MLEQAMSKTFESKESILKRMTLTDNISQGNAANCSDIEADSNTEETLRLFKNQRLFLCAIAAVLLITPHVMMGVLGGSQVFTSLAVYEYFTWIYVLYAGAVVCVVGNKIEKNINEFLMIKEKYYANNLSAKVAQEHNDAQHALSKSGNIELDQASSQVSVSTDAVQNDDVDENVDATPKETRLSADVAQQVAKILETIVVEQELFRQHGVSLRNLAQAVGVSTHDLSEVLNTHMKTSFYHYINSHRVAYAKEYLICSKRAVLDIATDSGFNSKTAFYNAFKKAYGLTPSQYRTRCADGENVRLLEEAS